MAYRRRKTRKRKYAGRVARRVSRKTYRGTRKMSIKRLRKTYASKMGKVAYKSALMKRRKKRGLFRRMKSSFRRFRMKRRRRY